jgi:small ligand-binding sensory domain FIST
MTPVFRFAHASGADWQAAANTCVAQLSGPPASLGFLYLTDGLADHVGEILEFFRQRTGVAHWVGTVGMGICASGREYFDQPALAVMVGEFAPESFQVFSGVRSTDDLGLKRFKCGERLARDLNRLGGVIFAGLPIAGTDTGDYLVRNLVGIDPARGIVAIGDVVESGSSIVFCRRDTASATEDMGRMLASMQKGLYSKPRGGVYYSCLGRGPNLFGPDSEELKMIKSAFGDFPLVGFFCNGEISHNRLYGYTGVLTLFT